MVYFTNIFCAAFSVPKRFVQFFSTHSFGFVIFWQKNIGTKAAHKMLVKFTIEGKSWRIGQKVNF